MNLKLMMRKLVGLISIIRDPGHSGCKRCRRRWTVARHHDTVYYTAVYCEWRQCFALCEECWSELTPKERVDFYRALYDEWALGMTRFMSPFSDIEAAVLKEE